MEALIRVVESQSGECFRKLKGECSKYIDGEDLEELQFVSLLKMGCIHSGQEFKELNLRQFMTEDVYVAVQDSINVLGPYLSGIYQFMEMLGKDTISIAEMKQTFPNMDEVFTAEMKQLFEVSRLDVLHLSRDQETDVRGHIPSYPEDCRRELLIRIYNSAFGAAQDYQSLLLEACQSKEFVLSIVKVLRKHPLAETVATKGLYDNLRVSIPEALALYEALQALHADLKKYHFHEQAPGVLATPGVDAPLQRKGQELLLAAFGDAADSHSCAYEFLRGLFDSGLLKFFKDKKKIHELCRAAKELHFFLEKYLLEVDEWNVWEVCYSRIYDLSCRQSLISVAAAWLGKPYRYSNAEHLMSVEASRDLLVCVGDLHSSYGEMEEAFQVLKAGREEQYPNFSHAFKESKEEIKRVDKMSDLSQGLLLELRKHSVHLKAHKGPSSDYDGTCFVTEVFV